jgi:NAD-dependent SIR2 family protein deacetylase
VKTANPARVPAIPSVQFNSLKPLKAAVTDKASKLKIITQNIASTSEKLNNVALHYSFNGHGPYF